MDIGPFPYREANIFGSHVFYGDFSFLSDSASIYSLVQRRLGQSLASSLYDDLLFFGIHPLSFLAFLYGFFGDGVDIFEVSAVF